MPIYAYRCAACGHVKDVLRKLSDPPLTDCPACGAPRFEKQVTAAGFQLKGSGWYVTDFREGDKPKTDAKIDAKSSAATGGEAAAPAPSAAAAPATAAPPAPAPAVAPAPPAPPASSAPAASTK